MPLQYGVALDLTAGVPSRSFHVPGRKGTSADASVREIRLLVAKRQHACASLVGRIVDSLVVTRPAGVVRSREAGHESVGLGDSVVLAGPPRRMRRIKRRKVSGYE